MPQLGRKYRLLHRLGGGGMAEVYTACATGVLGFERTVAVKRVLPGHSSDARFAEMFTNEARLASKLAHPNLVAVHDFDRDEAGQLYLVMEYVEGMDLRTLLKEGAVELPVALHVAAETLRGLCYVHELSELGRPLRIVHRDVSPHNILLSRDGAVKLADFGIARAFSETGATAPGAIKGKLGYMSPEQVSGDNIDARADLFAMGVVLHEMLTGRRLFAAGTDAEVIARVLHQPIAAPSTVVESVPSDVSGVVMGLLERDLDKRTKTARAALSGLLACSEMSVRGSDLLAARLSGVESPRLEAVSAPARASYASFDIALGATKTQRRVRVRSERSAFWTKTAIGSVLAAVAAVVIALWVSPSREPSEIPRTRNIQEVAVPSVATTGHVRQDSSERKLEVPTAAEPRVRKTVRKRRNPAKQRALGHKGAEVELGVKGSDEVEIN